MVNSFFCSSVVLLAALFAVNAFPGKRADSCEVSYLKLGCYKDKHVAGIRPLPVLLFTDRDASSKRFSGTMIDWDNADAYMKGVVCRCTQRAKAEGYMVFGIQFYGECWASKELSFNIDGMAETCVSSSLEPCSIASKTCVGKKNSIFVYNL